MENKNRLSDRELDMLSHNSWQVVNAMYATDVKLNTTLKRYDSYIDDMQYTLFGVDYGDNYKKKCEILLSELINLLDNHSIVIENIECIADDLKIFRGRQNTDLAKQYEEYRKYKVKCDLLQIEYTDIQQVRSDKRDSYILRKLIPDENGVAIIPDFVTMVSYNFSDNNRNTKYKKIIWKNPLVLSAENMFRYNDKIVNLDLTEFNLSVIPNLFQLLMGCNSLETVDFGNNDFHNVTNITEMFKNNYRLKDINLYKAKPTRECMMFHIANSNRDLRSLIMPEFSCQYQKLEYKHYDKPRSGILDEETGYNLQFTEIMLKKTRLSHVVSWLPENDISINNRIVAIYLDELTGINYIKNTISNDRAENSGLLRTRDIVRSEDNADFTISDYLQYINTNILLRFVMIDDLRGNGVPHFGRTAVAKELGVIKTAYVNSIDTKGYKNRLLLAGYGDEKAIYIVYFNNYSEW